VQEKWMGKPHAVTGVKENNGMIKIYIDGQLEGAGYDAQNSRT
jgi:hypothetical protein